MLTSKNFETIASSCLRISVSIWLHALLLLLVFEHFVQGVDANEEIAADDRANDRSGDSWYTRRDNLQQGQNSSDAHQDHVEPNLLVVSLEEK